MRGCVQKFEHRSEERKVIRKLLYITTIILTLAGCASEDYIGDQEIRRQNESGKPISLNLTAAPQTRSAKTGADAASDLNNNFVIWGDKTMNDNSTQTVFDNYQVNYVSGSENTTTSNSAGWEYVGYKNLPYGTGTRTGDTEPYTITLNNDGVAANATATGVEQTIKFWDYSASNYNFFAYSLGKGDNPETPASTTYAKASAMTTSGYTLSGSADQLKACYISNKKTVTPSGSSDKQVQLEFRNFASNVKIAFYEIVPGYSINNLQFYPDAGATTTAGTVPYLYAGSESLPTAGDYTISFDANGKAQVSAPTSDTHASNLAFGTALTYTADKEYQEAAGLNYIGRASNEATPTTAVTVLPNPDGTDLHLKVDYTLVSRDGYGETIHVTGATATVPAAYAKWQPNYSYTYLFKISDNTNGSTGQSILGLSPITFDAIVNVDPAGKQETITTVTNPSITTYQKGSDYATTNEYKAGTIYVVVTDGELKALTTGTGANAKLYKVTPEVEGTALYVTEASFAPDATKDANGNGITVAVVDASDLTQTNEIDADDSPDGKAVVFFEDTNSENIFKAVKFSALANSIYVFEYKYTDDDNNEKVLYKVIKVAPAS